MGDKKNAHECITTAAEIYSKHLGPEHPSTKDVLEVLQHLNKSAPVFASRSEDAPAVGGGAGEDSFGIIGDHFPQVGLLCFLCCLIFWILLIPTKQTALHKKKTFQEMPRAATQSPIPMPPDERAELARLS